MESQRRLPLLLSIAALVVAIAVGVLVLVDLSQDTPSEPPLATSEVFAQLDDRGYSMASRYGDLVWTAGHLPENSSGESVAQQTVEVMDNLEATLEEAGAGFDTVLMTNVYLVDFNDWDSFNTIYAKRFEGSRLPPRVTVEIARLGIPSIEISMVAHVRDQ